MLRSVHFKVSRREAILNRYAHEPILRKLLSNICLHVAAAEATSVKHYRYAMPLSVIDVEYGRPNAHAIDDLVSFNYAGWWRSRADYRWLDRFRGRSYSASYSYGDTRQKSN